MIPRTFVVVPCPRSRLDELQILLGGLAHDPRHTMIVTTEPDPIRRGDVKALIVNAGPGVHFGRWLNSALDHIAYSVRGAHHEVLVIGSSLTCQSHHAVTKLADALRFHDLSMIGPDFHGRASPGTPFVFTKDTPRSAHDRVSGHCFMVAGELGLRCDEQFRWWYSDDDLEQQARQIAPVGVVGGTGIRHDSHHALDPEKAAWAIEDRARFVAKWGVEP